MPNASEILISIVAKNTGLKKTLDDSKRDVKGFGVEVEKTSAKIGAFGNVVQGVFQGIGQAAFNLAARGFGALLGEIGKSTRAASDLQESINKVTVVFGESSKEILEWSKTSATALGQSQQLALESAGTFGNLFRSMGIGGEQAKEMSIGLVELAADLASFNNIASSDALDKLRSGIVGELEPVRTLGVDLSVAAVEAEAFAMGLGESYEQLTQQEKVLARYNIILRQTALAQGDFARTSGEIANQQRILSQQIEDGRAALGQAFTPIYGEILRGLNQLIEQVSGYGEGIVQALANGLVNGVIYLLPALRAIADVITYWLMPGSPPRLLPDIDKWMAETINAWLGGAKDADFGILKDLGSSIEGILRSYTSTGQIEETNLVSMVFGSQAAIVAAIEEWHRAGVVSQTTLDAIRRSAGPAGDAVTGLVEAYFELEGASAAAARAQEELNAITERYDRILSPLNEKLTGIQDAQQKIRDERRLAELGRTISDPTATGDERRLAKLEAQEIRLRRQIDAVEDERDTAVDAGQKKLEAAQKEEKAAQDKYDTQEAALDQQLTVNRLIAEEIALRERLAAEALAKQEAALRELEAAQRKAEQAEAAAAAEAKRHAAELERVYQAQLQYNLATADTPGKIALMRLELSRYSEGSAEYWNILTQIAGLEEQLARERDKAGGAGGLLPPILPDPEKMEIPSWAKELTTKLRTEIDKAFGTEPDFGISIKEGSSLLNRIIGPEPEKLPTISQDVKDFVDSIKALTTEIKALVDLLDGDGTEIFNKWAENSIAKTKEAAEESERHLTGWELDTRTHIRMMQGYMDNGWAGVWDAYVKGINEGLAEGNLEAVDKWKVFRGLLPTGPDGEPVQSDSPLVNLGIAGGAIIANLASGMAKGWLTGLLPGFVARLLGFRALLPGSEPTDTSSPLYDLASAGEAIVTNLWEGMKDAWENFSEWWQEKMQWIADAIPDMPSWLGGDSVTGGSGGVGITTPTGGGHGGGRPELTPIGAQSYSTNNNTWGPIQLVFNGPVSEAQARTAANSIQSELRRRGAPV